MSDDIDPKVLATALASMNDDDIDPKALAAAQNFVRGLGGLLFPSVAEKDLARAIQRYGDERAREAATAMRQQAGAALDEHAMMLRVLPRPADPMEARDHHTAIGLFERAAEIVDYLPIPGEKT